MKIVSNGPDQLALQSAPWVLGSVLVTLIVALTGAAMYAQAGGNSGLAVLLLAFGPGFCGLFFYMYVRRDDLTLDRNRDLAELHHATLMGHQIHQHRLHHVQEAIVEISRSRDGDQTYRPVLVLNDGVHIDTQPISEVYTGGRGAERAAAAINDWLRAARAPDAGTVSQ